MQEAQDSLRTTLAFLSDPDAAACCKWLAEHLGGWVISVQEEVVVRDPESGAILTRGTPDPRAIRAGPHARADAGDEGRPPRARRDRSTAPI